MPSDYATVSWTVDDIICRAREREISLTIEQALSLISKEEKHIREAMRYAAFVVIDDAIAGTVLEQNANPTGE